MGLLSFFRNLSTPTTIQQVNDLPGNVSIPAGRVSRPTIDSTFSDIKSKVMFVDPSYIAEFIPVIRKLSIINPDLGLAINDMVRLTNTGHRIKFDPGVSSDQIDKMRQHIEDRQILWGDGTAGMNGLVNKMIAQMWVSGALSTEWVVANNKKGIKNVALVNPETIIYSWHRKDLRFYPYQKQNYRTGGKIVEKMVKMGHNFKYYGINGDTELPYGIPPFLTALNSLSTQGDMDQNTSFIMKQLGLLGFFETLLTKPYQKDGESDALYTARLKKLLTETKANVMDGMTEGVMVGFKDDHEFSFNSTTKNLSGVSEIYNQNEVQVANGLKIAPSFLGVGNSGSETGINIIFTKMLSQLSNIQQTIEASLKFGYTLELRLAGFKFQNLRVEFNPSTITDDLKVQQGQEYKIRNVYNKYMFGLIGMQQAADELGYDKPDQKEPRGPIAGASVEDKDKDSKNDSAKKERDKKKPQPKRKDGKSNMVFQEIGIQ